MKQYEYNATAFRNDGARQSQAFHRLTDGILWLRKLLEAGDGHTVYGEVRCRDQLLWRRGKRSTVSGERRQW
jgi:hypothetical protein